MHRSVPIGMVKFWDFMLGYKRSDSSGPHIFESVEEVGEEGKVYSLELKYLRTYTLYSVIVQAYNGIGAGPMSDIEIKRTDEGTPDQPPIDVLCVPLSSHRMRVSWTNQPIESVNGVIRNYKVIYAPSDHWLDKTNDNNGEISRIFTEQTAVIKWFEKFHELYNTNIGSNIQRRWST